MIKRKELTEKKFNRARAKEHDDLYAWSPSVVDEHVQALRSREFNGAILPTRPLLVHHHRSGEPCYRPAVPLDAMSIDVPSRLEKHEIVKIVPEPEGVGL